MIEEKAVNTVNTLPVLDYLENKRKMPFYYFLSHIGKVFTSSSGLQLLERIPGFHSMKRLGVLLLPPDGMLVHHRLPPEFCRWYPFILLGGEKHCESKVFFPRTQHNDPASATVSITSMQSRIWTQSLLKVKWSEVSQVKFWMFVYLSQGQRFMGRCLRKYS